MCGIFTSFNKYFSVAALILPLIYYNYNNLSQNNIKKCQILKGLRLSDKRRWNKLTCVELPLPPACQGAADGKTAPLKCPEPEHQWSQ